MLNVAQMYLYLQRTQARIVAERDEKARRVLAGQVRAGRDAARAGWAPALDRQWLARAGLFETARAWGAAVPFADRAMPWYEPAAATAMHRAEDRLRVLHPHAMARYDRLRGDGTGPAEAMREAAPLFARPPRPHDPPHIRRPALQAGSGALSRPGPEPGPHGGPGDASKASAGSAGHGSAAGSHAEPGAGGQAANPAAIIRSAPGTGAAGPPAGRDATPWELDFPTGIREVVAVAGSAARTMAPAAAAAQQPARRAARAPGRRS